jgi:hypothetical protein
LTSSSRRPARTSGTRSAGFSTSRKNGPAPKPSPRIRSTAACEVRKSTLRPARQRAAEASGSTCRWRCHR